MESLTRNLEERLGGALSLVHTGKVRNSYALADTPVGRKARLSFATDRVSIYDFVLGCEIPQKGEVLTAMNFFWRKHLRDKNPGLQEDLLAAGARIDQYLPRELREITGLWKRALVVEQLEMIRVEAIVRRYLVGTGWDAYKATGEVCGNKLPKNLAQGSRLIDPVFTPTTKAQKGHDEHLDILFVEHQYGPGLAEFALKLFTAMEARVQQAGLLLADTKYEIGYRVGKGGEKVFALADEVGTPDSSRFWRRGEYMEHFPNALPPSLDKQFLREWGKMEGINDTSRFDPKKEKDAFAVKHIAVPQSVIDRTREIYLEVPKLLTGLTLEQYQRSEMGIR